MLGQTMLTITPLLLVGTLGLGFLPKLLAGTAPVVAGSITLRMTLALSLLWRSRMGVRRGFSRVILFGASPVVRLQARQLIHEEGAMPAPVAMLDDHPRKRGWEIEGIKLVGGRDVLARVVERRRSAAASAAVDALPGMTSSPRFRVEQEQPMCGVPSTAPLQLARLGPAFSGHFAHVGVRSVLGLDVNRTSCAGEVAAMREHVTGTPEQPGRIGVERSRLPRRNQLRRRFAPRQLGRTHAMRAVLDEGATTRGTDIAEVTARGTRQALGDIANHSAWRSS